MTGLEDLFGSRIAVVIDDVLTAVECAELRARLEARPATPVRRLERGSYDELAVGDESAVLGRLAARAATTTGRDVRVISEVRVLRFRAGDYLLAHADRIHDDHPVEVMLDVSASATPGAEVHYRRRGGVYFRAPSRPGAASVVERGPTVTCNHTYVSRRSPDACVIRLVVLLRAS